MSARFDGDPHGAFAVSGDDDGQPGLLHRAGCHGRGLIPGEPAVERAFVTAEQPVEDLDPLRQPVEALDVGHVDHVGASHDLVVERTAADAQDEPAVTDLVDRHRKPGNLDRIAPGQVGDEHAELDLLGLGCHRSQGHPAVQQGGCAVLPVAQRVADPGGVELGVLHPQQELAAVVGATRKDVHAKTHLGHGPIVPWTGAATGERRSGPEHGSDTGTLIRCDCEPGPWRPLLCWSFRWSPQAR